MIEIQRSRDWALIKKLATDPAIFPHIYDDYTRDPAKWSPAETELVHYLVASDGEGVFGFGIFMPDTWTCWKAHIGFLPRSYGAKALTSFKVMLRSMWENSRAARIVGEVCQENRRAIQFALRAGFVAYGVNRRSRLRDGVLHDQVCLGISKPD